MHRRKINTKPRILPAIRSASESFLNCTKE